MHYDILAEGIDVSGFTGIMPLRPLSKSKFLQTYGRSARPDKDDRPIIDALLKSKEESKKYITSTDWDAMNKPYAYIIVPNITHTNEDDKENTIQLITELRNYGFKPYEDIIGSQITKGEIDVEEPDIMNEFTGVLRKVGVLVDRLIAELEAERLANLSDLELAEELLKQSQ